MGLDFINSSGKCLYKNWLVSVLLKVPLLVFFFFCYKHNINNIQVFKDTLSLSSLIHNWLWFATLKLMMPFSMIQSTFVSLNKCLRSYLTISLLLEVLITSRLSLFHIITSISLLVRDQKSQTSLYHFIFYGCYLTYHVYFSMFFRSLNVLSHIYLTISTTFKFF